jgi:hypothetical protein
MAYKQYDKEGNIISHNDLQNKTLWCKEGGEIEEVFVRRYGVELDLKINPDKITNPYAPDLLLANKHLADLKTQNTPFFKAESLYGIDPSYAVVFNRKDAIRYYREYPEIHIYFWVEWHSVRFEMGSFNKEVEYISGVWSIPFQNLVELLKTAPLHSYQQRVDDKKGNARDSFVLDIQEKSFTKVI